MLSKEIRQKFLQYFKDRGHAIVPSSSLLPNDPSVLLTTAGMQQFKPYYTGKADPVKDFGSKNTASIQKCFRTSDIDEVGDESHLTFFEMLGNFSFGGYWKREAIEYAHEFVTGKDWMNLRIDYVSVFGGDGGIPADEESEKIWKSLGIEDVRRAGRKDNFWGPTGAEGPCGPTTEVYVNGIEIWNVVFNEYYKTAEGKFDKLKTPGIDTGMGLERLAMVSQGAPTIFETDLFLQPFGFKIGKIGGVDIKYNRIFADHLRGSVFLIADGIRPLNKDAGYILRRLIRRVVVSFQKMGLLGSGSNERISAAIGKIIDYYGDFYDELKLLRESINQTWLEEKSKFEKTLEVGLREFDNRYPGLRAQAVKRGEPYKPHIPQRISGKDAFDLHQSYGFTVDILRDLAREGGHTIDEKEFENLFAKHQEISRAGQEKKFGGHGLVLNTGELKAGNEEELDKVLRLHTATHLLQAALREVLGSDVGQMGSDITPERTRFDFAFPRKMTEEEKRRAEEIINQKIKEDLPVQFVELPKAEAEKSGALYFFKEKYPDVVKVYYVGEDLKSAWSKEFCGGPHVKHTGEIGAFKIAKEEATASGVRRIRGVLA